MTAVINLDQVQIDEELIRRIPYELAAYYQVVPLAREDGWVSVAMAHPDNATALAVLAALFDARVVPVWSPPLDIVRALARLRPGAAAVSVHRSEVIAYVDAAGSVSEFAAVCGAALGQPIAHRSAEGLSGEAMAIGAAAAGASVAVLTFPAPAALPGLLRAAATPIFLARGRYRGLRRILLALRGYASDEVAVRWALDLARSGRGAVTVLPLAAGRAQSWQSVLHDEEPMRRHIEESLRRLQTKVAVRCTYRQGTAEQQVGDECAASNYDLLIIAAEGYGELVAGVVGEVERRQLHRERPILVVKPRL